MLLGGSCSLAAGLCGRLGGDGVTDQKGGDVTAVGHGGGGDIAECAGGDIDCSIHKVLFCRIVAALILLQNRISVNSKVRFCETFF